MSNYTILEQNIMHGFGAYDDAEATTRTFLSMIDSHGLLPAEHHANEFGSIASPLRRMLTLAARPYLAQKETDLSSQPWRSHQNIERSVDELFDFIQTRHLNMNGGNRKLHP